MADDNTKKSKLYESIVGLFFQRIKEGALNPGDRLPPERVLAEELGVSRTAIREALRSMELAGWIESRVGEGTFIKSPDLSHIIDPFSMIFIYDRLLNSELIEARLILETEIARMAARRRDDSHLQTLRKTLDDMEHDIKSGGTGIDADESFHATLAQAAGNRALDTILTVFSEILSRTRRVTQSMKGVPQASLSDHMAIFNAIAAKDEKSACRLMRKHLLSAQRNLQKLK